MAAEAILLILKPLFQCQDIQEINNLIRLMNLDVLIHGLS